LDVLTGRHKHALSWDVLSYRERISIPVQLTIGLCCAARPVLEAKLDAPRPPRAPPGPSPEANLAAARLPRALGPGPGLDAKLAAHRPPRAPPGPSPAANLAAAQLPRSLGPGPGLDAKLAAHRPRRPLGRSPGAKLAAARLPRSLGPGPADQASLTRSRRPPRPAPGYDQAPPPPAAAPQQPPAGPSPAAHRPHTVEQVVGSRWGEGGKVYLVVAFTGYDGRYEILASDLDAPLDQYAFSSAQTRKAALRKLAGGEGSGERLPAAPAQLGVVRRHGRGRGVGVPPSGEGGRPQAQPRPAAAGTPLGVVRKRRCGSSAGASGGRGGGGSGDGSGDERCKLRRLREVSCAMQTSDWKGALTAEGAAGQPVVMF